MCKLWVWWKRKWDDSLVSCRDQKPCSVGHGFVFVQGCRVLKELLEQCACESVEIREDSPFGRLP